MALIDKYHNIVGNRNNDIVRVLPDNSYSNISDSKQNFKPMLEGNIQNTTIAGVTRMSNLNFTATPGGKFSNII